MQRTSRTAWSGSSGGEGRKARGEPGASVDRKSDRGRAVKNRHVRMLLPRAPATFADRPCQLFDLSVTGALLSLDFAPVVDSTSILLMQAGQHKLSLSARVVRVNAVPARSKQEGAAPGWTAGITFLD